MTSPPRLTAQSRRAIAGLVVTQIIGWGTTFNMPAVLGVQIGRELGMARELVFAGIGVMLLVAALVSAPVGRRIDGGGGQGVMAAGSLLGGFGLLAMSQAADVFGWIASWVIIGLAMPMMVSMGAFASLAHLSGRGARRAIATLMLFTGFSSTIFWPLGGWLDASFGWRATLAIYGLLHLAICLPLHLLVVRAGVAVADAQNGTDDAAIRHGVLATRDKPKAFLLLTLVLTGNGLIGWGLSMHIIDLFESRGVATGLAIAIGAMQGPTQISARLVDWMTGSRVAPLTLGLAATALMPVAAAVILVVPNPVLGAVLFVALYGVASGMMSIARSTIPLSLFGSAEFGAYLGRLSTPQNVIFAFSPVVFAAALSRGGPQVAMALALVISLATLIAMATLMRHCRKCAGGTD